MFLIAHSNLNPLSIINSLAYAANHLSTVLNPQQGKVYVISPALA